jgi:hypothetical protein
MSPTIDRSSSNALKAKRKPPAVKKPLPPRLRRFLDDERAGAGFPRGQRRAHGGVAAADHHDVPARHE